MGFKGGSLYDETGGFSGSEKHLALRLLALQNTAPRDDRDGFDGFCGFGVVAVSVVTAAPLHAAIRVPRESRERDGIAAKLLQCGIASEALRRNMRLSCQECRD